jgi:D-glycero-D-manno-heptose 1,7-bisphosphate phosphatase
MESFMNKKALFLDRDGVINHMVMSEENTYDSPQNENSVKIISEIIPILRFCNEHKIPVIEITNQPGVAKGKLSLVMQESIEKKVHELLRRHNVYVDAVYTCPHHPEAINTDYKIDCACRKPKPGLLLQASKDHQIHLSDSLFIGDNASDVEAAVSAGCTPILFFHEHDEPKKITAKKNIVTDYYIHDLSEALPIIKNRLTK